MVDSAIANIGISTNSASANNVDTSNINKLSLDKKAFIKAFEDDTTALKNLLVGTDALPGIFTQVETIVESAVASTSGYFSSTENNFRNQIKKIDDKIAKANNAVETYRARLESKFQHMDLMISKIQQQYSSFLGA